MSKRRSLFTIFTMTLLLVGFNNCGKPMHNASELAVGGALEGCGFEVKDIFAKTYHPFLRQNCAGCHVPGGAGNGGFAAADIGVAYDQFAQRGRSLVRSRALDDNHQPSYTGTRHLASVNTIDETWIAAEEKLEKCKQGPTPGPSVPPPPTPPGLKFVTNAKTISATATVRTISWNLGNEVINPAGTSFPGATFQVDVQTFNASGTQVYQFSNPRLTAGTQALHIMNGEILINGAVIPTATTFKGIDRFVGSGDLRRLNFATMTMDVPVNATDQVAFSFGLIEAVNFDPPTYTQLISASGVFGQVCAGCHSGATPAAGYRIGVYSELVNRFLITPYNPAESHIIRRMKSTTSPMPPAGNLNAATIQGVYDWILDGAPNN